MAEVAPAAAVDPLAGLVEIPLPMPVSLWPQTPASRVAVVLLLVGAIATLWWFLRWWHANRYRRAALAELDRIERALGTDRPLTEITASLAVLVRRTALAAFPRPEVAALAGAGWLAFLDRSYGGHGFSRGPGRALAVAPYQPQSLPAADMRPLLDLVRRWIRTHHD